MAVDMKKEIKRIVTEVIQTNNTNNPFDIADNRNIEIHSCFNFEKLKGAYITVDKNKYIFLNGNLTEDEQRFVCAHELGHDVLHQDVAAPLFVSEFDSRLTEREANIFAAHLLISDEDINELVREEYKVSHMAALLHIDEQLVLYKLKEEFGTAPDSPSTYFLK